MNTVNRPPLTFSTPFRRNKAIAHLAVKEYEHRLKSLASIHLCSSNILDWPAIRCQPAPKSPVRTFQNEQKAFMVLAGYEPAFLIKTFQLTEARRKHLEKKVQLAREMDEKLFALAIRKYTNALTTWQLWQLMSVGVLGKNLEVYQQVLDYLKPLDALTRLGVKYHLKLHPDEIQIDLRLPDGGLIPKYALSLTSSGKLSRRMLPDSRANELYCNFVCGIILRAAREVAACLPIARIHVRSITEMPDVAAGGLTPHTIVDVSFHRLQLEMESRNPYETILSCPHQMRYSRTHGFSPVRVGL